MFRHELDISVGIVEKCVKASCVFHNFKWASGHTPAPGGQEEPLLRVLRMGANFAAREATDARDVYFSEEVASYKPQKVYMYKKGH